MIKGLRTAMLVATTLGGILASSSALPVSAAVSEEQWKTLVETVGKQDWNKSVSLAEACLRDMDDSDDRLPRLRYIYLYAAEGDVSEGRMSFEDLDKLGKSLVGKTITLPFREVVTKVDGALNFITGTEGDPTKLMVTATNQDGTTIHAFEYFSLKEPFDVAKHNGELASISGVVDKVVPNPNKSRAIVGRIFVKDAKVTLRPANSPAK